MPCCIYCSLGQGAATARGHSYTDALAPRQEEAILKRFLKKAPPSLWSTAVWADSLPPPSGGRLEGKTRDGVLPHAPLPAGPPPTWPPPVGGRSHPTARGGRQESRYGNA